VYTLNCCAVAFLCTIFSRAFSASGVSLAVCSTVAILAAVEELRHLELWDEWFCGVVKIVDVAPVCDTFVCRMIVVQIDHDRAFFFGLLESSLSLRRRGITLEIVPQGMLLVASRSFMVLGSGECEFEGGDVCVRDYNSG
jgi:hypothetical protein